MEGVEKECMKKEGYHGWKEIYVRDVFDWRK